MADDRPAIPVQRGSPSQHIACTPCRKVKMKCNPGTDVSGPCRRCHRKKFSCVYEGHRRGRKPGFRLEARVESSNDSTLSSLPLTENPSHLPEVTPAAPSLSAAAQEGSREHHELRTAFIDLQDAAGENANLGSLTSSPVRREVKAISPFRLLNRHAVSGTFCVQNVLEAKRMSTNDDTAITDNAEPHPVLGVHDPIARGLVNIPTAMQLFDSFVKYLSPYIIHFDPILYTFEYVQSASSFLLVSILSAAARIFNPKLYNELHLYSEKLLSKTFISGEKSVEIIQAVLIKTYWKEPDDSRVWQLVGYASRMCAELHGGVSRTTRRANPGSAITELDLRRQRNLERTWLTIFVYDRSVSLQLGKPWMLQEDDLVRTVERWYSQEMKMPQSDAILAAFVQLRVIGSDMLVLQDIDSSPEKQELREMSLNLLSTELYKWDKRWRGVFQTVTLEPCHRFLFEFYGQHFRLYINSLRLESVFVSTGKIAREALWLSYSSAIKMLEAIVRILGPAQLLYFAQDSIHVMTAFAAVLVTKLLLLLPEALPATAENTIIGLLSTTSKVFSEQCVTTKTSCAYQARFLRQVVAQYWTSKPSTGASEQNSSTQSLPVRYCDLGTLASAATQEEYISSRSRNVESSDTIPPREAISKHAPDTSCQDSEADYRALGGESQTPSLLAGNLKSLDFNGLSTWNPNLDEPDIWEGLFINAGFNI